MVIDGQINNTLLRRVLVDDGSAVNLMTFNVFKALGKYITDLRRVSNPVVGLGGTSVPFQGFAMFTLQFGGDGHYEEFSMVFIVVDIPFAYNAILGRPFLYDICASTCIKYLVMKIPMKHRELFIRGN